MQYAILGKCWQVFDFLIYIIERLFEPTHSIIIRLVALLSLCRTFSEEAIVLRVRETPTLLVTVDGKPGYFTWLVTRLHLLHAIIVIAIIVYNIDVIILTPETAGSIGV